jgi:signal recognition particle receptor subunit beta
VAYIDVHSGELVLKLVYDGPAGAGKTTSLQALDESLLSAREGALLSPTDHDPRGRPTRNTPYFDWRELRGGRVGGRLVRCQLLSVPGQWGRWERREVVLRDADAVVLVVAADEGSLREGRSVLRTLRQWAPEAPLLVQLNKTDREACVPVEAARAALGLESEAVFEAAAIDGRGVGQVFLSAMARITSAIDPDALPRRSLETPETLMTRLQRLIEELPRRAADRPWPAVWPMARLYDVDLREEFRRAGAAHAAGEGVWRWRSGDWSLETREADVFESEDEGRADLVARARSVPSPGRALVLVDEGPYLRLWSLE